MELPRDEMELSLPGMASQPPLMGDVAPPDIEPVLAARPASAPSAGPFSLKLSTAAELANGGQLGPPVAPDAFCQGMVVRHPEFGLGKIVALSGTDAQRAATIDFASAAGRRRLVLLDSPLRPVR
jgi:DNA helicase-2/ATP-dependent DNA helicase PcrA